MDLLLNPRSIQLYSLAPYFHELYHRDLRQRIQHPADAQQHPIAPPPLLRKGKRVYFIPGNSRDLILYVSSVAACEEAILRSLPIENIEDLAPATALEAFCGVISKHREGLIVRALESCLKQSGRDFEVVVVDDGSSDQTVAAIEALRDERIHLLVQDSNRGHSTARNIALDAAKGEWVVILDSDDELLPGGLDRIRKVVESGGIDVDCYEFMYARDDGGHSPDPPMIDRRIDFKDYLRSWNHRRFFDALRCIRRSAALQTPWREWQTAGALFH